MNGFNIAPPHFQPMGDQRRPSIKVRNSFSVLFATFLNLLVYNWARSFHCFDFESRFRRIRVRKLMENILGNNLFPEAVFSFTKVGVWNGIKRIMFAVFQSQINQRIQPILKQNKQANKMTIYSDEMQMQVKGVTFIKKLWCRISCEVKHANFGVKRSNELIKIKIPR